MKIEEEREESKKLIWEIKGKAKACAMAQGKEHC